MERKDVTEIIDLPVITRDTGEKVGTVEEALFEPDRQELLGLVLSDPEGNSGGAFVPRADVLAFGPDAVIVSNATVLQAAGSDTAVREIRTRGIQLSGAQVLTEGGEEVGSVESVYIDEDGSVVAYRLRAGFLHLRRPELDGKDVVAIGPDAIVARVPVGDTGRETSAAE